MNDDPNTSPTANPEDQPGEGGPARVGLPDTSAEASPPSPEYPFGFALHEMDVEAFFNMRGWLQAAVEAKGAKMTGGGLGMGQADIDIELDGCAYNISIKPLPRARS